MWVFKGKFTAEQGALIAKALEGAMDELFEEQKKEPSDFSAETANSRNMISFKRLSLLAICGYSGGVSRSRARYGRFCLFWLGSRLSCFGCSALDWWRGLRYNNVDSFS